MLKNAMSEAGTEVGTIAPSDEHLLSYVTSVEWVGLPDAGEGVRALGAVDADYMRTL